MNVRPSILCPIDFSDASAGALLYAAAIASHLVTRVVVLTVEEPLLTEALELGTGASWTREHCQREMEQFAGRRSGPTPRFLRHSNTRLPSASRPRKPCASRASDRARSS